MTERLTKIPQVVDAVGQVCERPDERLVPALAVPPAHHPLHLIRQDRLLSSAAAAQSQLVVMGVGMEAMPGFRARAEAHPASAKEQMSSTTTASGGLSVRCMQAASFCRSLYVSTYLRRLILTWTLGAQYGYELVRCNIGGGLRTARSMLACYASSRGYVRTSCAPC